MTAVLSKSQATRLFDAGLRSGTEFPGDSVEGQRIKWERRLRAKIKRHVPTQRSETCCMGSGRRAHWPYREANAAPGPVVHIVEKGHVKGGNFGKVLDYLSEQEKKI